MTAHLTRNHPVIAAAVQKDTCRHCSTDGPRELCLDCARCGSCGHSPECITRKPADPEESED